MKVRQARAAASRWVAGRAAAPDFAGAYLSGSAAWLPADADLPATSDVDVMVVTTHEQVPPKPGKLRHEGVLLDVTYLGWSDIPSAETVLSHYHLAGGFRTNTVVADPTGRLTRLSDAVARDYAKRSWVRRRCEHARRRIVDGLATLDPASPFPRQVMAWLFPAGVTAHVLLTAGLRNPTVRLRYLAARALLHEHGLGDFHEELLGLLGCAAMTPARAGRHLDAMTRVFDAAAPMAPGTRFPFAADITPEARPIAVDGGHELIARGRHREAVFWITATYARCLLILGPHATTGQREGFAELAGDLGVGGPGDLPRRAGDVARFLPRLDQVTEAVLAASPATGPD
ncbi:hypothetical protein [Microbispora sp. NPDC049125]|uniref:hypothetical protein n=1 Tax=Microbispora sp. NPDC049125 TaxID=3154929 RepID=UPI0034667CF9